MSSNRRDDLAAEIGETHARILERIERALEDRVRDVRDGILAGSHAAKEHVGHHHVRHAARRQDVHIVRIPAQRQGAFDAMEHELLVRVERLLELGGIADHGHFARHFGFDIRHLREQVVEGRGNRRGVVKEFVVGIVQDGADAPVGAGDQFVERDPRRASLVIQQLVGDPEFELLADRRRSLRYLRRKASVHRKVGMQVEEWHGYFPSAVMPAVAAIRTAANNSSFVMQTSYPNRRPQSRPALLSCWICDFC